MISLTISLVTIFVLQAEAIEVGLRLGKLRGQILEAIPSHRKYASFKGVPYAQPPIGKLRFKNPEAVMPWEGVREAIANPPMCAQLNRMNRRQLQDPESPMLGQEDCLYLNVYIPLQDGN